MKQGLVVSLAVLFVALVAGCASIVPGADPVLVNAERSTAVSFHTVDQFLQFDDENRALLAVKLPAVHDAAESLRKDAPAQFQTVRQLTVAYEAAGAFGDKAKLQNALAQMRGLSTQANGQVGTLIGKPTSSDVSVAIFTGAWHLTNLQFLALNDLSQSSPWTDVEAQAFDASMTAAVTSPTWALDGVKSP